MCPRTPTSLSGNWSTSTPPQLSPSCISVIGLERIPSGAHDISRWIAAYPAFTPTSGGLEHTLALMDLVTDGLSPSRPCSVHHRSRRPRACKNTSPLWADGSHPLAAWNNDRDRPSATRSSREEGLVCVVGYPHCKRTLLIQDVEWACKQTSPESLRTDSTFVTHLRLQQLCSWLATPAC